MTEMQSRIAFERATLVLGRRRFESVHGGFDVHFFRDQAQDRTAMAIACGDLRDRPPLLARVHSSCVTSECLMARDCDCADQLGGALATIAAAGRGVVFYLIQEGRGAGLTAKARDRMIVRASRQRLSTFDAYTEMGLPPDLRRYDSVGPMARALGIRAPLMLLANNPEKAEALALVLSNEKIELAETLPLQAPTSPFNRDYLRAKRYSGHALARGASLSVAMPPAPVEVEPPLRAVGHPHLISTACYFLPVGLTSNSSSARHDAENRIQDRVDWFRLRVVYDQRTARESVLLSLISSPALGGSAFTLTLVDRLPGLEAGGREALRLCLLGIRERGEGRVVVHFDDSDPAAGRWAGASGDSASSAAEEILAAQWIPTVSGEAHDAER